MAIDTTGRDIILARNGQQLGAAKKHALSPEDVQLLANMRTNRQARAVLGVIAQHLRHAYELVDSASSIMPGTAAVKAALKSRLDGTNRYAQKTYAGVPDDDAPVSAQNRKRVEECVRETRAALTEFPAEVEDINAGFTGALADTLMKALPPWLRPQSPQTKKILLYVGIGTAVLVAGVVVYKLVTNILFSGAALGAAEEDALAIVDAKRRKRHSRSAFSIS